MFAGTVAAACRARDNQASAPAVTANVELLQQQPAVGVPPIIAVAHARLPPAGPGALGQPRPLRLGHGPGSGPLRTLRQLVADIYVRDPLYHVNSAALLNVAFLPLPYQYQYKYHCRNRAHQSFCLSFCPSCGPTVRKLMYALAKYKRYSYDPDGALRNCFCGLREKSNALSFNTLHKIGNCYVYSF